MEAKGLIPAKLNLSESTTLKGPNIEAQRQEISPSKLNVGMLTRHAHHTKDLHLGKESLSFSIVMPSEAHDNEREVQLPT